MPRVPEGYLTERRRQILAAASQVFSKRGVQAATITEVASEAGVSPGLIYRYLPSKEELAFCAMSESTQDLDARWQEPPVDHPDPLGEFFALSAATFAALHDPQEQRHTIMHFEQVLSTLRDGNGAELTELREMADHIVQKIQVRLDAACQAGQVGPDVDTRALAQVAVDFYWGVRVRLMANPEASIDEAVQAFNQMMSSALSAER
jgi:AcrR family transcriptional regulator